ncbi:MAG: class I SAM-dependent RNA methyltransferase [Eubacteriaceae bacterium]|nr:class I SAM-dependent RNA methyltransferase [Eubacteriaceae bacterium]
MIYNLCATCTFGLESVLRNEIWNLGFKVDNTSDGKVYFKTDNLGIAKANLYLRTADRVLLLVGEFNADSFDMLYDNTAALEFEKFIPADGKFDIHKVSSVKSTLASKSDCQAVIKKAVAERLKKMHSVSDLPESGADFSIYVSIKNDIVQILINTSGPGLNKRGYRAVGNEAPLKETLAAAMVLLSDYSAEKTLADVMCGSGTILIEAAMIMKNIAPGINRSFACEKWNDDFFECFKSAREEAKRNVTDITLRILGSDIDYFSIKQAKENAEKAGVGDCISFQKLDLKDFSSKKKCGVIISNAPYGMRTGGHEVLRTYKDLGIVYRNLNEWSAFILCGHENFEKAFGQRSAKNRKLYNGGIKTYFYSYYPKDGCGNENK